MERDEIHTVLTWMGVSSRVRDVDAQVSRAGASKRADGRGFEPRRAALVRPDQARTRGARLGAFRTRGTVVPCVGTPRKSLPQTRLLSGARLPPIDGNLPLNLQGKGSSKSLSFHVVRPTLLFDSKKYSYT